MRLCVGVLACFVALNLFTGRPAVAQANNSNEQAQHDSYQNQERPNTVDWFSVYRPKSIPVTENQIPVTVDAPKDGPVLLPLPPEGWACLMLLVSIAGVRGLKRARLI